MFSFNMPPLDLQYIRWCLKWMLWRVFDQFWLIFPSFLESVVWFLSFKVLFVFQTLSLNTSLWFNLWLDIAQTEVTVLHGQLFATFLFKKQYISAIQINYKRYIRIQLTFFFPGHPWTVILANMGWHSGITVGLGLWLHHLLQGLEAEICITFESKTPCKSVCCGKCK